MQEKHIYICIEICLLYECMDMHCRVATVLLAGTPPELPPGILRKNPPAQLKKMFASSYPANLVTSCKRMPIWKKMCFVLSVRLYGKFLLQLF